MCNTDLIKRSNLIIFEFIYIMIEPVFESMPIELTKISRWLIWKELKAKKVPFNASLPEKNANVIDINTWSLFSDAKSAYRTERANGVGFVLSGDGIVCIDIDDCFEKEKPVPEALILLESLNCKYIEISYSGKGLHGLGYSDDLITKKIGKFQGLSVEIYSNKRFIAITGKTIKNEAFDRLSGIAELSAALTASHNVNTAKNNNLRHKSSFTLDSHKLDKIYETLPRSFFPRAQGQRNRHVFILARFFKFEHSNLILEELRYLVKKWHKEIEHIVKTKDFYSTWSDFNKAYEKAICPIDLLDEIIIKIAKDIQLPDFITDFFSGDTHEEEMLMLIKICAAYQYHSVKEKTTEQTFYISCRHASTLLTDVFPFLRMNHVIA